MLTLLVRTDYWMILSLNLTCFGWIWKWLLKRFRIAFLVTCNQRFGFYLLLAL